MEVGGRGDGPAAALQQLQEHVAQLQAENERLLNEHRNTVNGRDAQPVQKEQALYIPSRKVVP